MRERFIKILQFLYALIPSYARFGLVLKISLTIFLFSLCANLFYAKINPAFILFKSAMTFSPVAEAEKFIANDQLKTAEDYIDFYLSIPGGFQKDELTALREKIHAKRTGIISGTLHQGKHAWKGITGQESDEVGGTIGHAVFELSDFSDVRDLYVEWQNYSSGKEVDKLSAGLAGVSLAMTLADWSGKISGLATGGSTAVATQAMITPIKKTVGLIRKSLKFMNSKLRKATMVFFEPVFKAITKTKILSHLPMPKISAGSMVNKAKELQHYANSPALKTYLSKNVNHFKEITSMMKGKLHSLSDILTLAKQDPAAVTLLIKNSNTVKQLSSLSQKALSLGKNSANLFRFGGKNLVPALEKIGLHAKNSASILKQSMKVGATGLKAVAKGCWRALSKMVELAYKYKAVLWLLMIQSFFALIPLPIALFVELLLLAVIFKSWPGIFFFRHKKASL